MSDDIYSGAVGLRLEGARAMRAQLKAAGSDLSDLKAANREAAALVARAATGKAPHRSGDLAATVRSSGTKTAGVIRAGRASVPYANPIHWGWFSRHIKPNPWVALAAKATEPAWIKKYEQQLAKILAQIEGDKQ